MIAAICASAMCCLMPPRLSAFPFIVLGPLSAVTVQSLTFASHNLGASPILNVVHKNAIHPGLFLRGHNLHRGTGAVSPTQFSQ